MASASVRQVGALGLRSAIGFRYNSGVWGARTVGGGRSAVRPAPAVGEQGWRAHRARPARASLYVYKKYRGLFPRYIVGYIVNYIYVPACILFVLFPGSALCNKVLVLVGV